MIKAIACLMTMAALLAGCSHKNDDMLRKQILERHAAALAGAWMNANLDPEDAMKYSPISTAIADTFWLYPSAWNDPVVKKMEDDEAAIAEEYFQELKYEFELNDINIRLDSVRAERERYMIENRQAKGFILEHIFMYDNLKDTIYLATDGMERILSDVLPPCIEHDIREQEYTTR